MKIIEIKQTLAEEILDKLEGAQKDYYVQSTENVISELKQALHIPHVSQQRELLMAYEQFLRNDIDQEKMHNAGLRADAFLAINCG